MITAIMKVRSPLLVGLLGVALTGCDDLLTVSDPQRYSSDDLDASLEAVANGVEGDLYAGMDEYVIYTALNSDEYQHTGTWIGYDNYDHGRFFYGNASGGGGGGASDGVMNDLLVIRAYSISAQERIQRVLGDQAATSPLMARAKAVEGWSNLLVAQSFCEAPAVANGPAVADEDIYELAVSKLGDAITGAEAANLPKVAQWAQAGRARANLMLRHYDAALADAEAVPDDFVWSAQFSLNSGRQENGLVNLTTTGFNNAAAVREKWWASVDSATGLLKDPWTGQPDPRLPVRYKKGALGVDGTTPHYSQWKYRDLGADIPLADAKEMRLIEAEVYWRRSDPTNAMARINAVREAAGLSPLADPGDPDRVLEYLLHERFAELFLEGQRMNDLHRFGLVGTLVTGGAFGTQSEASRPTKFPLSRKEAINNTEIEDDASQRCLPRS